MTREEKITHLSGLFKRAADARALAASEVWAEAWVELERTLLDELLACGPTEDEKRYRMQTAIEVGRTLRRLIEAKGATITLTNAARTMSAQRGYVDAIDIACDVTAGHGMQTTTVKLVPDWPVWPRNATP